MGYYGTGWFWQRIDAYRHMLVPMSTQYETPPLRWHHDQLCAVDRMTGVGCTCSQQEHNIAAVAGRLDASRKVV